MSDTGPDPFAVLGLEPRFDLDPAQLEARFRERSREVHPDRFAGAPAGERAAALVQTRALNDAYQVLKRPQRRAEHLLARAGVVIDDREKLDPAFLMEILDRREELAEARAAGRIDRVNALAADMRARQRALVDGLAEKFAALSRPGDGAGSDADRAILAAIKRDLITLRYVGRYVDECDAALDAADE